MAEIFQILNLEMGILRRIIRVPAQNLGPHVAPLGLEFYHGENFPDMYRNQILIAEHGSWNRAEKIGYQDIYGHVG